MKLAHFYGCLLALAGNSLTLVSLADEPPSQAAALVEKQENEERFKRWNALMEDMRDAYAAQQKKINALAEEVNRLREDSIQAANKAATQEQLRELAEKIQEIDKKRETDKQLILAEIQKLAKLPVAVPTVRDHKSSEPKDPEPVSENYYTYEVKSGDYLSTIIAAYNEEYKKQGKKQITLEQVKKANPGLNPNSLRVGKKINIPMPADK